MMTSWDNYYLFACTAIALWCTGAVSAAFGRRKSALCFSWAGTAVLAVFVCLLWLGIGRPPLRTMGETRLWYALFMGVAGGLTYLRWGQRWILAFSALLSTVFSLINLLKPEIHDQTLMPALQSGWFVPHVTVYMFSYALLGCATLSALMGGLSGNGEKHLQTADSLVYQGTAFLTVGMLFGALWAKEAWGNYWTWDPKETWAAITWGGYLLYIHLRLMKKGSTRVQCAVLIVSFLALQMCWYGINYLPAAQESIHIYNR